MTVQGPGDAVLHTDDHWRYSLRVPAATMAVEDVGLRLPSVHIHHLFE